MLQKVNEKYYIKYYPDDYIEDIIGEAENRYDASKFLVKNAAMYTEIDGVLHQFMEPTQDYKSFNDIQNKVYITGKLEDEPDIYKIVKKND